MAKKKKPKNILYHYCSNNAFHSIIESKSIRLSSLSQSNDWKEGKLVAEIIMLFAKDDKLGQAMIDHLQKLISFLNDTMDGLGFCLSKKGDLLSQWRGYADDAAGVSIGFSKDYLKQFAKSSLGQEVAGFTLNKIVYSYKSQEELLKPAYDEIRKQIDEGALTFPRGNSILFSRSDDEIKRDKARFNKLNFRLRMTLIVEFFGKLFLLKSNAFREEQEWRLISIYMKRGTDECSFRAVNNQIVPFREFKLPESEISPVVEVILGPKNMTPNFIIKDFLKQNGFPDVNVKQSEASYR